MRINVVFLFFILSFDLFASIINIEVEGYVSYVEDGFKGYVSVGDEMNAVFSFDSNTITRTSAFEGNRVFHYLPLSFGIKVGDFFVSGNGGRAEVSDNYQIWGNTTTDRFILQTGGVSNFSVDDFSDIFDISNLSVGITFYDYINADSIASTNLPSVNDILNFPRMPTTSIQMNLNNGVFDWIPLFADVTKLSVTTGQRKVLNVDAPNAISLFAVMIILLLLTKKSFIRNRCSNNLSLN